MDKASTLAECDATEEGEVDHSDGVVVTVESGVLLSLVNGVHVSSLVNGVHVSLVLTVAAAGVTESDRTSLDGFT